MRIRHDVSNLGLIALVVVGLQLAAAAASAQTPIHPLDPLTVEELATAAATLAASGHIDENTRYHLVNLHQPAKSEVLHWKPGDPLRRQAFAVLKQGPRTFEATIDLSRRAVTTWKEVEGAQPNLLDEEIVAGGEAAKRNPEWQAAMRRRGITDFDSILCAALSPGYYGIAEEAGRRLGKTMCFQLSGTKNFWGRPIEGVTTLVDLNSMEVIRVIDTGAVPVPSAPIDYDEASAGPPRDIPTSISVEQPEGPAFRVNGHEVSWQKWTFRFRIDPRVGLVVSRVGYADGGELRSIIYEGALAELFVPYMDPDAGWYWRTYFDAGELLVGVSTVPLEPGVDCPGNARYFDAVFADSWGQPQAKPRAACLFERYAGDVAWRHWDFLTGDTETRKKRDLVLRLVATLGNYDYTFDWTFQQDGTIRVGVGASGVDQVKAVASRTAREASHDLAYGRLVSEHTLAVNHDHFFSFRLDLDVDGADNSLLTERLKTVLMGEEQPRASVWVVQPEIAQVEEQGKRRINLERPALWRVVNPGVLGPLGYPVSYQIMPGANAVSLLAPDDFAQLRAGFVDYHLWVTPQRDDERYPAGVYPVQSKGRDGLPTWTSANRPIANTDIVVWYTLGFHHVVRAEDWPVMPTSWHSFELRPFDFFVRNPALDLPAQQP